MKAQEKVTDQGVRAYSDARVEALLGRTLAPHPPPESLRRRVRQQVAAEWERRPLSLRQRLGGLLRAPTYRQTWAAVAALAIIAVVAALVLPSSGVPVAGTVLGKGEAVAAALTVVAVIAIVVAWLVHKHRQ
ncbi:MAG TPA: hypothetical protein PKZ84_02550 [Anaerolineae bacterium]|nr:hypothetical protein [Anaerolineae bacterium]HQI83120.1 hypothetical protein [Anaerolineae bacterium]